MTQKDNFEERLLSELRQVVAERPEPAPARSHGSRRPARFAIAGGGLAAAVAAVVIFTGSGDNTPSAYAVAKNPDGAVTVSIKSLKDPDGLEMSLREAGVPAEVDYSRVMPTIECTGTSEGSGSEIKSLSAKPTRAIPTDAATGEAEGSPKVASGATFTIDPKVIKEGDKVYVTLSERGFAATRLGETKSLETLDTALRELDTASVAMSIGGKAGTPDC